MKKLISLLLSVVMLFSITIGVDISAYAGTKRTYNLVYGVNQFGLLSDASKYISTAANYYKFSVSSYTVFTIKCNSNPKKLSVCVIDESEYERCNTVPEIIESTYFNENTNLESTFSLYKGTYYVCIIAYEPNINYNLIVTPIVYKPTSFKVSTRKTTSLKLSWNKVSGVSGYQLQQYKSNKWTTIKTTSSNSYTVSGLKSGTSYKFRVRAYKTIDGKKYYSSWTSTLTTPTKPSTPTIKTPSTNSKHQIIVKWKKVSACSGYQVQYSKKSNFSSVIATKTVSGQSKTSYTGKNFTKGRKYYVRVRAYKTVKGKKYYSSWSKSKSIVCK